MAILGTREAPTSITCSDTPGNIYANDVHRPSHASTDLQALFSSAAAVLANSGDVTFTLDVSDFRTMGVISATGLAALAPVTDQGEAGHGTTTYAASVSTGAGNHLLVGVIVGSIPNRIPQWEAGWTEILNAPNQTPPVFAATREVSGIGPHTFQPPMSVPTSTITLLSAYAEDTGGGGTSETLEAEPGTITITGQPADLVSGKNLSAEPGSLPITGFSAALSASRRTNADPSTITLAGQGASLRQSSALLAAPGTITITGFPADMIPTTGGTSVVLPADPGAITIVGGNASLRASVAPLQAEPGSLTITGFPATLPVSARLHAFPGNISISGGPANFINPGATPAQSTLVWKQPQKRRHRSYEMQLNVDITNAAANQAQDTADRVKELATEAGYGGLITVGTTPTYSLGAGWTKFEDFGALMVPNPRGITPSVANDTLAFAEEGIYVMSLSFTFDHDESNQGRSFDVRLFNETDANPSALQTTIGVGRNTPYTNVALSVLFKITAANVGDELSVEFGNGDAVVGEFLGVNWSAWRVSEITD